MLSLAVENPSLMVGGLFFSLCMNKPINIPFTFAGTPFLVFRIAFFGLGRYSVAKSLEPKCLLVKVTVVYSAAAST